MNIVLVCANGMSTSLLASKMKKAAEKSGLSVNIQAVSETNFEHVAAETDVLLLGPQVKYLLEEMREKYEVQGMKIRVIDRMDYGMMNGEKILKAALA